MNFLLDEMVSETANAVCLIIKGQPWTCNSGVQGTVSYILGFKGSKREQKMDNETSGPLPTFGRVWFHHLYLSDEVTKAERMQ